MKKQGISGAGKKSYTYRTTDSAHTHEVATRPFKTEMDQVHTLSANQVWASDITYIRLRQGFCFLCVYMDIALRKIVGYSVRDTLQAEGVIDALKMAIGKEHPPAGLIVHTNRGVQYACEDYWTLLEQYGFKMSMSRKGNCYDNAFMESFFRSLKVELIHRHTFFNRRSLGRNISLY